MGFKLKNSDLQVEQGRWPLMEGLMGLAQKEFTSIKESNNLRRMIKQLQAMATELRPVNEKLLEEIAKKHGEVDEEGKFIPAMNNQGQPIPGSYRIKESSAQDYIKDKKEFEELETPTVESYKLKLSELEKFNLAPIVLLQLDAVIEDDLDIEESEEQKTLPFPKK